MNIETPYRKYCKHRNHATKIRNIPFTLTFEEWMEIWMNSGHWEQRGRGHGKYVMSRYNDQGGYTKNNVFIQLNSDNVSDACKGNTWNKGRIPTTEQKNKASETMKKRRAEAGTDWPKPGTKLNRNSYGT